MYKSMYIYHNLHMARYIAIYHCFVGHKAFDVNEEWVSSFIQPHIANKFSLLVAFSCDRFYQVLHFSFQLHLCTGRASEQGYQVK